ncbi:hypothetical protein BCAR13_80160 [Paraburkholderia caribensis]|uniref:GIY-YIG nuclease family protein n=1 Tax=Paraburkholderia caribensis TaxID=75105 RepID=UPI001CB5F1A2|nr:hypothetical protein BCAR13_80160 [Paraburkholderia caribensis]
METEGNATGEGWVYVAENRAQPGIVKIGRSGRIPEYRVAELDGTHTPYPFTVPYRVLVPDCALLERRTHLALAAIRLGREFFACSVSRAADIIKDMAADSILYQRCDFETQVDLKDIESEAVAEDPFRSWVASCANPNARFAATRSLFMDWCTWAERFQVMVGSEKAFVRLLVKEGFVRTRGASDNVRGRRGFIGLAIPQRRCSD